MSGQQVLACCPTGYVWFSLSVQRLFLLLSKEDTDNAFELQQQLQQHYSDGAVAPCNKSHSLFKIDIQVVFLPGSTPYLLLF